MKSLWAVYENGSKIYAVSGGGGMTVECMVNGVRCDVCGLTREEAKAYAANPEQGIPASYWNRSN